MMAAAATRREGRRRRPKEQHAACFVLMSNDNCVCLVNKQVDIDRKPREDVIVNK